LPKTSVGLFKNSSLADQVVRDLEASGFPRNDVRILSESLDMAGRGVKDIPNIDFAVSLNRDLRKIGASGPEAEAYVKGVRHGGVLVFASGSNERIDAAAEIMNQHSPVEVEELAGGVLNLPSTTGENVTPTHAGSVQTGRVRQSGSGARVFAW
jgi:hypothetical protein